MKKLFLLSAFAFIGFVSANAQTPSVKPTPVSAVPVAVDEAASQDKPAKNNDKKSDSHCADKKESKSCGSEKKACCAHGKKTEAKKEENK